jgi:hypothetical protein
MIKELGPPPALRMSFGSYDPKYACLFYASKNVGLFLTSSFHSGRERSSAFHNCADSAHVLRFGSRVIDLFAITACHQPLLEILAV